MEAKAHTISPSVENPPGGLVIWILILLELLTFGMALFVMVYMHRSEVALFTNMAQMLDLRLGTLNTVVLLSSGYAMAISVLALENGARKRSDYFFVGSMALGMIFLLVKFVEYRSKYAQGLTLGENTFMDFYWLLTGFHAIHILVGILMLVSIRLGRRGQTDAEALSYWESGAAFWHLCDLIWLMIFPALYILYR
jgi:nitric oxide reductase NorE protein